MSNETVNSNAEGFIVNVQPAPGVAKQFRFTEGRTVKHIANKVVTTRSEWTPQIGGKTVKWSFVVNKATDIVLIKGKVTGNN